jgi:hypothetical protein
LSQPGSTWSNLAQPGSTCSYMTEIHFLQTYAISFNDHGKVTNFPVMAAKKEQGFTFANKTFGTMETIVNFLKASPFKSSQGFVYFYFFFILFYTLLFFIFFYKYVAENVYNYS